MDAVMNESLQENSFDGNRILREFLHKRERIQSRSATCKKIRFFPMDRLTVGGFGVIL